jgi:hypothetical protein
MLTVWVTVTVITWAVAAEHGVQIAQLVAAVARIVIVGGGPSFALAGGAGRAAVLFARPKGGLGGGGGLVLKGGVGPVLIAPAGGAMPVAKAGESFPLLCFGGSARAFGPPT